MKTLQPTAIAAAWLVPLALATPAQAAPGQTVTLSAGLFTYYDSNILEYSPGQIDDFNSGLHPARYSITTIDDAVFKPSLGLTWELDQGGGRRHAVSARWTGGFHARNSTADNGSIGISWRESFHGTRHLTAGYYRLPDYYLRQLYNDDWTAVPASVRYQRAEFGLQIASLDWSQRLGSKMRMRLGYQYEHRGYNPDFTERTSHLHQGEGGVSWIRLPRHGVIELHGGYRFSTAAAQDSDEVAGSASDDPDVSYHGALAGVRGRMDLTRGRSLQLGGDLGYDLETRAYDSSLATDRYHYGRSDVLNAIEVGLSASLRRHWSLRASYRYENNVASLGAVAPPGTDSGSYRVSQAGLSIEWTGDILHRRTYASED
jgi:hypothetical protein